VWTVVNVENWSPLGAMPRAVLPPPMGQPLLPDVPNWAWHEYGIYLTGVPHRIKYLEMLYDHILGHDGVVMWTGAEILDWYRTQVPADAGGR
jgi:hypothetical protein